MALIEISAAHFLKTGLSNAGFDENRQESVCVATNMKRFRASFGVSPETCSNILTDLQKTEIVEAKINKPHARYLLMALNWLRQHRSGNV